jgi:hypothetical protein
MRNKEKERERKERKLSGGENLLARICLSQRIFFIPRQRRRRGNTRRSAWCKAPIPTSWM